MCDNESIKKLECEKCLSVYLGGKKVDELATETGGTVELRHTSLGCSDSYCLRKVAVSVSAFPQR